MTQHLRITVAVLSPLLWVGVASAQTLEVVPSLSAPPVGTTLTADVQISGLASGTPSLGTFDLTLSFDPAVLAFTGAAFGTLLGDPSATPAEAVTAVTAAEIFEVSLLLPAALNALQPDAFTLFTATFDVIGRGATALSVGDIILGDDNGDPLPAMGAVQIIPGAITAGPAMGIPILSAWGTLILIGALTGFGVLFLRRLL